jgi:hypothetical protein
MLIVITNKGRGQKAEGRRNIFFFIKKLKLIPPLEGVG